MKRFTAMTMAIILCLFFMCACKKQTGDVQPTGSGDDIASAVVVKTEHFTVSADMYQFYFMQSYNAFYSSYGQFLSALFDAEKPLREQECTQFGDEGYTWYDYFCDGALDTINMYLVLAEDLIASGWEMSEEVKQDIDSQIEEARGYADEGGYESVDAFLQAQYGELVTEKTLKDVITLYTYAYTSYKSIYGSFEYTDEQIGQYADDNPSLAYTADYMLLSIGQDMSSASEDEIAAALSKNKEAAEKIDGALTDAESFTAAARDYYNSAYSIVTSEEKEALEDTTGVMTEDEVDSAVDALAKKGVTYSTASDVYKWIFTAERAAGDHTVIADEKSGSASVVLITRPMHKSDARVADVRHILLSAQTCGDDDGAKAKADELLAEFLKDASEEHFAALADKYTEDSGSLGNGGLYTGMAEGQTVQAFNDWLFDSARAAGDTGIVKSEYGYHIMYCVKSSYPVWISECENAMRESDYQSAFDKIAANIKTEANRDVIALVPEFTAAAEGADEQE